MVDFLKGVSSVLEPESADLTRNAGAIKDGPFAKSQPGYQGNDGKGFAVFKSDADAHNAHASLLRTGGYKDKTPAQIVQRYAPPGPENSEASVRNYIGYVSTRAGIDPDKPVPPEKMAAFAAAQREFETGKRPPIQFKPYGGAVAKAGGGNNAGVKGGSTGATPQTISVEIPDVSTIAATAAEQAAMGKPYEGVQNPNDPTIVPSLQGSLKKEGEKLSFAESVLQRVTAESQQNRTGLVEDLKATVAEKASIADQIKADAMRLAEAAKPGWERREALGNQLLKVNRMNPLEQGLRSIFDPNYDRQAIRAEIRGEEEGLRVLDQVFSERQKHGQTLAAIATGRYVDQEALVNLLNQNGGEDVRLALQAFSLASQQTDTLLSGLKADGALMQARAAARADVLSGLTVGQINSGLAQAQASTDGTVTIQGIPIRAGELQEVQARVQQQSLQIANTKIAIQQGNIEVADANKKAVLKTMTEADAKAAIAANGVFNGIQFDVTELAARLQEVGQAKGVIAGQQAVESAPGIASSIWTQVASTQDIQAARFTALFGTVPGDMTAFAQTINAQATQYKKGYEEAKALGIEVEYAANQLPQLQALIKQQQGIVDTVVNRWAGGNADLKALGSAWMTGQPVNSETAVKGLIHFARNGIPAGTKFTGPAAQMLRVIKEELAVKPATSAAGQMTIKDLASASSGKESEKELIQRVQARLGEEYNGTMGLELYHSIPAIAKDMKAPFSRITGQQWEDATNHGDAEGARSMGESLGMSGDDFVTMLKQGPGGGLWQARVKGLQGAQANFSFWQDSLTTAQMQSTMAYLDSHAAAAGFVPSYELRKVTSSPNFLNNASRGEKSSANGTFGGFLANAAGGSNFLQNAEAQGSQWGRAYEAYNRSATNRRISQISSMNNDPIARADYILKMIPGLAPVQEQLLLGQIKRIAREVDRAGPLDPRHGTPEQQSTPGMGRFAGVNRTIDSFIQSGDSEDPSVKAALGVVRKQWGLVAPLITQANDRLAEEGRHR